MIISELKKDAKIKLSGKYWKAISINLLYVILTAVLEMIGSLIDNNIFSIIYSILIIIISLPFSYGLIASMIKISRNEEVATFDFINIGLQNIGKVWKIYGRTLLKLALPIFLMVVAIVLTIIRIAMLFASYMTTTSSTTTSSPVFSIIVTVLMIAAIIYLIVKALLYVLTSYVLYDNQNASSKEIVEKSAELMKGNRGTYVLLNLSFIGWYLLIYLLAIILMYIIPEILATIIIGIGTVILIPYISVSLINFYEDLAGTTKIENPVEESTEEI